MQSQHPITNYCFHFEVNKKKKVILPWIFIVQFHCIEELIFRRIFMQINAESNLSSGVH